jgi:BTB/POZ domain
MLPKPLLRRESLFFECCLKEGFAEARISEIILEEDDLEIFAEVVKWIYTHRIEEAKMDDTHHFWNIYILADRFGMEAFKNAVVEGAKRSSQNVMMGSHPILYLSISTTTNFPIVRSQII